MARALSIIVPVFLVLLQCGPGIAIKANQFSLQQALANPKELPKLDRYDYSKEYFKLRFLTPVSGYRYAIKNKEKTIFHKNKRKKNAPLNIHEDELEEVDFWSYKKPVVSVMITPQPQTKNTVKLGRTLGYTTAAAFTLATFGIGMATLGLPGKIKGYKVSKDFYTMSLQSKKGDIVCNVRDKNIGLLTDIAQQYFFPDDHYTHFINKLFLGVYEFDPECFLYDGKLKLTIDDKNGKRVLNFTVPKKLKKAIWEDFNAGGINLERAI